MQETRRRSVTLVPGVVRSGQSRHARQLAEPSRRASFAATAKPADSMKRIFCLLSLLGMLTIPCAASRTVTDELGRTVVVPDHPHRVICLMPSVTDTVFALGAGDDVVGISDYTAYPAEALKKPSVGDLINPSIETILALHPDLIIGVQPTGPMASTQQLERLGLPVFLTSPHGIAGIIHSVETIGEALNRTPQADVLAASLQHRVDAVRARTKGLPEPKVFMPIWYDPIITIGKHAFTTEIIEAAGAHSVTDDLTADWPPNQSGDRARTRTRRPCAGPRRQDHARPVAEPSRLEQRARCATAPRLLRGRPHRFSQPHSDRCTGGPRQTISSLRLSRSVSQPSTNKLGTGKRGANPPLPRNCKRREPRRGSATPLER